MFKALRYTFKALTMGKGLKKFSLNDTKLLIDTFYISDPLTYLPFSKLMKQSQPNKFRSHPISDF